MNDQELQAYGRRLFERRREGILVRPAAVSIGDWGPSEHECHGNVTTWCQHNPQGHKPVRGWLYFDFGLILPYVRFTAHSVVEQENGELADITPSQASQEYPFIRAEETEDAYAALIADGCLQHINYYWKAAK